MRQVKHSQNRRGVGEDRGRGRGWRQSPKQTSHPFGQAFDPATTTVTVAVTRPKKKKENQIQNRRPQKRRPHADALAGGTRQWARHDTTRHDTTRYEAARLVQCRFVTSSFRRGRCCAGASVVLMELTKLNETKNSNGVQLTDRNQHSASRETDTG